MTLGDALERVRALRTEVAERTARGAALRDAQRDRLCDALEAAGPDAPTLCTGWTAADLAAHVWILDHDPIGWIGLGIGPLEGIHRARIARVRDRLSHAQVIERLREGDGSLACMRGDVLEGHRHALGEHYVHTQDVVRATGDGRDGAEDPSGELSEALWRRAAVAARALHLTTPGLVLAHLDGRTTRVLPGRERVRVTGAPSEVLLWVHGRTAVADVQVTHR